jgi:hypothetical protein
LLYTIALVGGIFGALAYGTASSALAQVVTPHSLAVFGPSVAMLAVLLVMHWGAYQGPVVFTVPDVAFLLGAPLPRRALAVRRLVLALAGGAIAGAAVACVVLVGVAGKGRGIDTAQAAGLIVGLAELATIAVAGAWAVERSKRFERAVSRATWPGVLAAAGLAAVSGAGSVGRDLALWAGPWGWAVQSNAGESTQGWLTALLPLTALTAVAAGAAIRTCGDASGERHLRRAEARAGAIASLASFDARTARQTLATVDTRSSRRSVSDAARLRTSLAAFGSRSTARTLAVFWRDTVAALRTPGRVAEATALGAGGTVLTLLDATKPVAVAAGMFVVYLGAARLLWPLRAELDAPGRTTVLLRPRLGRVLLTHALLSALLTTSAATLGAVTCATAGALPRHGAITTLAVVTAAPMLTFCAAMSARRGGRVPQSLLFAAVAGDPSGGGVVMTAWLAFWPALAATLASIPILLATHAGPGAVPIAAGLTIVAAAGLAYTLDRDPIER